MRCQKPNFSLLSGLLALVLLAISTVPAGTGAAAIQLMPRSVASPRAFHFVARGDVDPNSHEPSPHLAPQISGDKTDDNYGSSGHLTSSSTSGGKYNDTDAAKDQSGQETYGTSQQIEGPHGPGIAVPIAAGRKLPSEGAVGSGHGEGTIPGPGGSGQDFPKHKQPHGTPQEADYGTSLQGPKPKESPVGEVYGKDQSGKVAQEHGSAASAQAGFPNGLQATHAGETPSNGFGGPRPVGGPHRSPNENLPKGEIPNKGNVNEDHPKGFQGGDSPKGGLPKNSIPKNGAPNSGIPSSGPPKGAHSEGGIPKGGIPGEGIPGSGIPKSHPEGNTPKGGIPGEGIPSSGTPKSLPKGNTPKGGIPSEGIPSSGIPKAHPEGNTPKGGVPGEGIPSGSIPKSHPENNIPKGGIPGEGIASSGIPKAHPEGGFPKGGIPGGGIPSSSGAGHGGEHGKPNGGPKSYGGGGGQPVGSNIGTIGGGSKGPSHHAPISPPRPNEGIPKSGLGNNVQGNQPVPKPGSAGLGGARPPIGGDGHNQGSLPSPPKPALGGGPSPHGESNVGGEGVHPSQPLAGSPKGPNLGGKKGLPGSTPKPFQGAHGPAGAYGGGSGQKGSSPFKPPACGTQKAIIGNTPTPAFSCAPSAIFPGAIGTLGGQKIVQLSKFGSSLSLVQPLGHASLSSVWGALQQQQLTQATEAVRVSLDYAIFFDVSLLGEDKIKKIAEACTQP